MKSSSFCNVTPCGLVVVYRCLGGTYCLRIQGRRLSQASSKQSDSEGGGSTVLRNFGELVPDYSYMASHLI
jgi:hypothetical protein